MENILLKTEFFIELANKILSIIGLPILYLLVIYSIIYLIVYFITSTDIIDKSFRLNFFTPLNKILSILVSPVLGLTVAAIALTMLSITNLEQQENIIQLNHQNNLELIKQAKEQHEFLLRESFAQQRELLQESNQQIRNVISSNERSTEQMRILIQEMLQSHNNKSLNE